MILRRNSFIASLLYLFTFAVMVYVCLVKLNPDCDCSNYEKTSSKRNVQEAVVHSEKLTPEIQKPKGEKPGK